MKKIIIFMILLSVSCSKKDAVVFCEGTDTAGKPVKSGKVFTTGMITVFGSFSSAFGTETVTVKLYDTEDGDILPEETQEVKVDPLSKTVRTDFLIINESLYKAVVEGRDGNVLGEGSVKIIE